MKARFLALAALVLGLASCQTEPEGLDVNVGGAVDTTITVSIPETETRAGGTNSAGSIFDNVDLGTEDDNKTMRYILKVYDANNNASENRQVAYSDGKTVNFDVRLVPNRHYSFVVWADYVESKDDKDFHYDTSDLTNITLKGEWNPMDETRDAFTGVYNTAEEDDKSKYNGSKVINITLTRPFAKLRVKTTDIKELTDLHISPAYATVEYKTEYRPAFNALVGEAKAAGSEKKTHTTVFPVATYTNESADLHNRTLFTDYFFANEGDAVSFVLNVYEDAAGQNLIKSNDFNTDIAVNRNYLTTIKGNILTDGNNVKVDIIDAFAGETEWPDENKNSEQLAYAAMFGGEVTLTEDVVLTQSLTIVEGANVVLNLGNYTISGPGVDAAGNKVHSIVNNGTLTIVGGTISSTGDNGGSAIQNKGTLTVNDATLNGAPNAGSSWPSYAVNNTGVMTLENTTITSYHGAVASYNDGAVVTLNNCTIDMRGIPGFTSHGIYTYSNGKVVVNGGTYENKATDQAASGASVINGAVEVNAGTFSGRIENYYGTPVLKGGTFSVNPNANFIAAGYKAIAAGGLYYVLPEKIADAAETAGVTAVTESTADVATALATNNGEVTMFMWNDVAYIAKYGEVVITSAAAEATTVRGVVESSAGLTSATVADGIEVVGNRTFRKCANLETVALPNTLTEIGPAVFQSCSQLANITIPESVTTIGEGAFAECTALTSINIPYGVTRLEKDVLRNTGLVSVEIPASVNYIGTYAFRDCESLTEVKILSPEFTIENNTFTNMAAPVPTMTIYVVNDEMKAYLESVLTNYDKSYITVKGPKAVNTTADLQAALANGNKIVTVAAGDYTFPSSVAAGVTIKCEEGTVFTGTSDLNINGATVIGAEFKNENGTAVSGTIYGNFKNCTFTGSEALRWCYSGAGKTTVFENCVIKTDFRGFHYDGMNGDVIFRNCEINGFNAYGGDGTATFEGCTFGCDESRYNGLNIYANTNLVNCTFNFVSGKTNFVDLEEVGKTLTITNCTANLDGVAVNIADYVGGSKKNDCTVTIK